MYRGKLQQIQIVKDMIVEIGGGLLTFVGHKTLIETATTPNVVRIYS